MSPTSRMISSPCTGARAPRRSHPSRSIDARSSSRRPRSCRSVRVTNADLSTVHRIADGALSPIEGPMDGAHLHRRPRAAEHRAGRERNTRGRSRSRCPSATTRRPRSRRAGPVAVRSEGGDVVGIVEDVDVFEWDKPKYLKSVYRTERVDHPGGRQVEQDDRTKLFRWPASLAFRSSRTPSTPSTCSRR